MAQIMEFLLNLLLLRGKLLTSTAAETIHEAIKKCLQFKRKISSEYATTTQVMTPFENMLDYINYSASQYRCESENFMVANETHYDDMYDYFSNLKSENINKNFKQFLGNTESIEQTTQNVADEEFLPSRNLGSPQWMSYEDDKKTGSQKKHLSEDLLVGNIYAIFKSQELLFKNITKLINILESSKVLTTDTRLEKIKKKLVACSDILSNSPRSQLSNIINNIIEEEITRCRFRHGESKTSAEISLKSPQPEGIAAALDTSHKEIGEIFQKSIQPTKELQKQIQTEQINDVLPQNQINSQVQSHPQEVLKRQKSGESQIDRNKNYETILKKIYVDVENSKKLIEVTEEHFNKFENSLWHSLTTTKFMSLKEGYLDTCKCVFRNKKHFQATEIAILNKIKQESEGDQYQKYLERFKQTGDILRDNMKVEIGEKNNEYNTDKSNPFSELCYESNKQSELMLTKNETSTIEENKIQSKETKEDIGYRKKEKESTSSVDNRSPKQEDQTTVVKGQEDKSEGSESNQTSSVFKSRSEPKMENQNTNTIISGENLKNFIPTNSKDIFIAVLENKDNKVVESRQKFHPVLNDQATNTIINSFLLADSSFKVSGVEQGVNVQKESKSFTHTIKNDTIENKKMHTKVRNESNLNKKHSENFRKTVSQNLSISTTSPGRTMKGKETFELNKKVPQRDESSQNHSEEKQPPKEELNSSGSKKRNEPNNWKEVLQNISKKADNIIDIKEERKVSKEVEEKSELAKILEKHSRTLLMNNQYKSLVQNVEEKENRKNVIENKGSKIHSSQKICGKNTKLQSVVSETGKLTVDVGNEWQDNRGGRGAVVSLSDLKNQAECIEMNEKAFREFETAIRNVQIIIEKPSKTIKTTTKSKKFKFDNTSKKSMSTQQVVDKKLLQSGKAKEDSQVNETRHNLYKQIKKQTAKPTLPTERTFLKVSSKLTGSKVNTSAPQKSGKKESKYEDAKKTSLSKKSSYEKEKPNPQMRRTTKNAMKRQQVLTILPNVTKETKEKKKSQVSLVETEEIKVKKLKQVKKEEKKRCLPECEQTTVNTVKSGTSQCCVRSFHKEQSRKIHCVQWDTEDDAKIVSKLKS